MKVIILGAILLLCGCGSPQKDSVNPEGPWYSPQFLEEHPRFASDMYLCSNYYKHQYVTKHTVPIVCGAREGQCGFPLVKCDCVCHKEPKKNK